MVNMFRLVRKEEAIIFAGLPERFRMIPDFRLGAELSEAERASDLDFDYIAPMISEEHTGVRIEACQEILLLLKHRDSWAVYAINLQKKKMLACIHECIPGASVASAGWTLQYNTAMHPRCDREESWIYAMHCLRDYNGEEVNALTDGQLDYMAKSLVYKMVTMKENMAQLPFCLRGAGV